MQGQLGTTLCAPPPPFPAHTWCFAFTRKRNGKKTNHSLALMSAAQHYYLSFLFSTMAIQGDRVLGLVSDFCGRLKRKGSLSIAREMQQRPWNGKTRKEKEQNINKITWLILHFYFTGLKGENVVFPRGVALSLVSHSSSIWRGVPESSEFQEKWIL